MTTKKKSGTSKFILGAALGAAVGAIASKFIKINLSDKAEADDSAEDGACCCKEGECHCDKVNECQEKSDSKSTKEQPEPTTAKKTKEK